jgi:hypothetical protein
MFGGRDFTLPAKIFLRLFSHIRIVVALVCVVLSMSFLSKPVVLVILAAIPASYVLKEAIQSSQRYQNMKRAAALHKKKKHEAESATPAVPSSRK